MNKKLTIENLQAMANSIDGFIEDIDDAKRETIPEDNLTVDWCLYLLGIDLNRAADTLGFLISRLEEIEEFADVDDTDEME